MIASPRLYNSLLSPQAPTHDGLIRIQNEISEVEKREIELRKEHASSRSNSVNGDEERRSPQPKPTAAVDVNSKDHFKKNKIIEPRPRPQFIAPGLTRAYSTPQLFQVSPMKRFNVNTPHKGIMEKFIASRGKMLGNQQYTTTQNNFKKNLMMVRQHPKALSSRGITTFVFTFSHLLSSTMGVLSLSQAPNSSVRPSSVTHKAGPFGKASSPSKRRFRASCAT